MSSIGGAGFDTRPTSPPQTEEGELVKSLVLSAIRPRSVSSHRIRTRNSRSRPTSTELDPSYDTSERGRGRYRDPSEIKTRSVSLQVNSASNNLRPEAENQLLPCTLSTVKFSQTATAKQVTFVPSRQKLPPIQPQQPQSVVQLPSYQDHLGRKKAVSRRQKTPVRDFRDR